MKTPLTKVLNGKFWAPTATILSSTDTKVKPFDVNFQTASELPPSLRLSRLSAATYFERGTNILRDSAIDEPRFEDDGLLIEKAGTNLFAYSNGWTRDQLTASLNAVVEDGVIKLSGGVAASCRSLLNISQEYGSRSQISVLARTLSGNRPNLATTSNASHGCMIVTNGTVTDYKDKQRGSEWVTTGNRVVTLPDSTVYGIWSYVNNIVDTVITSFIQVEPTTLYNSSFIRARGTATSRAADVVSVDAAKQSMYMRYKRHDDNQIESAIVDIDASYDINLPVGVHMQRLRLYDGLIPAADRNLELLSCMLVSDHDFTKNPSIPANMQFSRLSVATYPVSGGLAEASIDQPRFNSDGIVIERQSTNIFPNNMFSNGYLQWGGFGSASSAMDANQLTPTVSFVKGGASAAQGISGINAERVMSGAAGDYTFSMRYKTTHAMGYSYIISSATGNQSFVSIGASNLQPQPTPSFQNYSVKLTPTAFNTATLLIGISNAAQFDFAFNNVQFETLPYASSLILTRGTAASRAADRLTVPAQNQSILIKCLQHDTQVLADVWVDATSDYTLDLGVGVTVKRITVFDHILGAAERALVLQEIGNV